MNSHIALLILIMLITGVFGGFINFLLELRDNTEKASTLRSIITGTGASFLVPLFLNMISSDLIVKSSTEPERLLVFAGFCLIASISSSAFIRTLSDRILKEAKEAKQIAEEVRAELQPVVERQTEIDPEEFTAIDREDFSELGSNANKILHALASSNYTWRSITGISKDTGLDHSTVEQELFRLSKAGRVNFKVSSNGGKRWSINLVGRMEFVR